MFRTASSFIHRCPRIQLLNWIEQFVLFRIQWALLNFYFFVESNALQSDISLSKDPMPCTIVGSEKRLPSP